MKKHFQTIVRWKKKILSDEKYFVKIMMKINFWWKSILSNLMSHEKAFCQNKCLMKNKAKQLWCFRTELLGCNWTFIFKVKGYTFRGSNSVIFSFSHTFQKGSTVKERICSWKSKFFPYKVHYLLERFAILWGK